jgi:cytochrome c oxidase subunit 1
MSVTQMENTTTEPHPRKTYLNEGNTIGSWLLTKDHKRIAIMFLISISLMFIVGGWAATMIRAELVEPQGHLMSHETYNKMFSMHGIVMIFFFLIPSIPAVLGNFMVPIMIGARDLAFPRLNLLSLYLYILGAVIALAAMLSGGVDTGWTFYTPYSSVYSNTHVTMTIVGIFIAGFSSIFTGINFIVTIHKMRAPGLTWFRLPLFVWAIYATSIIFLLGTPVIAITLALVVLERTLHLGIFNPAYGGDPILFQNLFWFYSHPAVYIMILPSMGVVSEIIPCFARKKIFGYNFIAFSSLAIALFGFLVWGHHMFVSGQSVYSGMIFSLLSFLIAVPSAVKVFNWTATMYKGRISFDAPMLYALGFIGLFTMGGLTGLYLASLTADVDLHDTYFVVAHFHYIMVGGAIMGFMGGMHFWWPKMTGRMYPERWAKIAAVITFIGFNFTFFPQFILGYMGMPRRYHWYPPEFQTLNILSSIGAAVLAFGYIIPAVYFIWSLKKGPKATQNPWRATGLEWEEVPSPPPTHNFERIPIVEREAYDYEWMDGRDDSISAASVAGGKGEG